MNVTATMGRAKVAVAKEAVAKEAANRPRRMTTTTLYGLRISDVQDGHRVVVKAIRRRRRPLRLDNEER
jgi:hypothetical protein